MAERQTETAVGAGTAAGDARDEEEAPESRAAEAESDAQLESLHVTGASPAGPGSSPPDASTHGKVRPGVARDDLEHNQSGIASRVPGVTPGR